MITPYTTPVDATSDQWGLDLACDSNSDENWRDMVADYAVRKFRSSLGLLPPAANRSQDQPSCPNFVGPALRIRRGSYDNERRPYR
jgi:hypothetical protein